MSSHKTTCAINAVASSALLYVSACSTDGNIGRNACPSEWSCTTHPLSASLVEVDTKVPVLAPVFTRAFSTDIVANYDPSERVNVVIAPGSDQTAVVVARDQRILTAHHFDKDGRPLNSQIIDPPPGFAHDDPASIAPSLIDVVPSESGALIVVDWLRPAGAGFSLLESEWVFLAADGVGQPVRLSVPHELDNDFPAVARTGDGEGILVIGSEYCWRFDMRGQVVWKRSSRPRGVQHFMPQGGMLTSMIAQTPSLAAGVPDFTVPIAAAMNRSGGDTAYSVAFGTLTLTPDGDIALTQHDLDTLTEGASGLRGGQMSVAHDVDARLWTFVEPGNGDLYALNSESAQSGYRFLRQEYRELDLGPTRSAPDGSMFFLAVGGGREDSEQSVKLCRVQSRGAHCFGLKDMPDSLLPLSATQVLVANGAGLSRYDLPTE